MLVLTEDAAEAVMSADIQRCEPIRVGDWLDSGASGRAR